MIVDCMFLFKKHTSYNDYCNFVLNCLGLLSVRHVTSVLRVRGGLNSEGEVINMHKKR